MLINIITIISGITIITYFVSTKIKDKTTTNNYTDIENQKVTYAKPIFTNSIKNLKKAKEII
jgi:hypothetical protein